MEDKIIGILYLLLALGCGVISLFQFREKGFLFNNAYIWASKEQREKLNKKPHYRQSAITFALLSLVLLFVALGILLDNASFMLPAVPLVIAVLVYVMVSAVRIEQENTK